jgi:uncharacterized Zn finger protein
VVVGARWRAISSQCAGRIASVLELLQGRLSNGVMEVITDRQSGLFPKPSEISLDCSCPDWADMCKHVAAALYGVGARLDERPELLFVLRQVDHLELIEQAAGTALTATAASSEQRTIGEGDLAEVFGIEMDAASGQPPQPPAQGSSAANAADGVPARAIGGGCGAGKKGRTAVKSPASKRHGGRPAKKARRRGKSAKPPAVKTGR